MNFNRIEREDGDTFDQDIEAAAKERKRIRRTGYEGSGELGRMLLSLEALAEHFHINDLLDYDEDVSDVDGSHL